MTVNAEKGSNEVGVATATSAERTGSSAVQESNKLYITEENFPDAGLRQGILDSWDMEGEGWVNPDNVISLLLNEMDISSLEGIELFPKWYYTKYGDKDLTVTRLFKYNGEWYYVKNGVGIAFAVLKFSRCYACFFYIRLNKLSFDGKISWT